MRSFCKNIDTIEKMIPALQDGRTVEQANKNIQQECDKIIANLKIRTELKRQ